LKNELLNILPPVLVRVLLSIKRNGYNWTGNYGSFSEALAASTGYEEESIIEAAIRDGKNEKEKKEIATHGEIQLLASMSACFNMIQKRKISILDFGGSTGAHYRLIKRFTGKELDYTVCETPLLVKKAVGIFSTRALHFIDDIKKYRRRPDIILSSGALQYVPEPKYIFRKFAELRPRFIVMIRFPATESNSDRLTVQRVPRKVYNASYPCWFFSGSGWELFMQKLDYVPMIRMNPKADFIFLNGRKIYHSGYILKSR
jgi:putative methyltransferase (TIGR04325 family)